MPGPFPYQPKPGEPEAPFCDVTISWNARRLDVRALIDSGAGITTIPSGAIGLLGLRRIGDLWVRGAIGQKRENRGLWAANIEFLGMMFTGHPVAPADRDYCLIGRDILNRYVVTLNGPGLEFSVV